MVQLDDGDVGVLGEAQDLRLLMILDEVPHVLFPGIAVGIAEIDGDIGVAVLIIDGHAGTHRLMVQVPYLPAVFVRAAFHLVIGEIQRLAMQVDLVHGAVGPVHGQDIVRIFRERADEAQAAGAAHVVFDLIADARLVLVRAGGQAQRLEERALDVGDDLAIGMGAGTVDVDLLDQGQKQAIILDEARRLDVEAGRRRNDVGRGAGILKIEDGDDARLAVRRDNGGNVLAVRCQADPIDTVAHAEIFGLRRRGRDCGGPCWT